MVSIYDKKIDICAVVYSGSSHVLNYRFNPEQDLTYLKEYNFLGFKFKLKRKLSTEWNQPEVFFCGSPEHDEKYYMNWHPIFIHKKKELDEFKRTLKTYEDLKKYCDKRTKDAYNEYLPKRRQYLEDHTTWY